MLDAIGLGGLTTFVIMSAFVGARLIALALRTRQLPETILGASLIMAGTIGNALALMPMLFESISAEASHELIKASLVVSLLGQLAFCAFVWLVFRRSGMWGKLLFVACSTALIVGTVGDLAVREIGQEIIGPAAHLGEFGRVALGARIVMYVWGAAESFTYYGMLRKRVALGLANEELAARFFHWGICLSASTAVWFVTALGEIGYANGVSQGWTYIVISPLALIVTFTLHQAFFRVSPDAAATSSDPTS